MLLQLPTRLPARAAEPVEDAAAARLRRQKLEDEPPRRVARSMRECVPGRVCGLNLGFMLGLGSRQGR